MPEAEQPQKDPKAWLHLTGVLLGVFALRVGHFWGPTFRDEGIFGYVAQEILRGHLPLTTVYENKGVLLFYEMALALAVGGFGSIAAIRFFGTVLVLFSLAAFFAMLRSQFGDRPALLGTALLGFHWSLAGVQGNYYGSEMFAIPAWLVAYYCIWKSCEEGKPLFAACGGLFLSLAVWTRLTSATFVIAMAFYLVFYGPQEKRVKAFVAYSLAGIFACFPFLALYASQGQLPALQEAYFSASGLQLIVAEAGGTPWAKLTKVFWGSVPHVSLLVVALFVIPVMPWWKQRPSRYHMFWLVAGLVAFLAPQHYLLKQAHQIYPPLCALIAWRVHEALRGESWQRTLLAILTLSCLTLSCCLNLPGYWRVLRGDHSDSEPLIITAEKVSTWVQQSTEPQDEMFLWGVEWEVYFRAQRRSPVRQINLLILLWTGLAAEREPALAQRFEDYQTEIYKALRAHPPKVMIVTAGVKDYDLTNYWLPAKFEKMIDDEYDYQFYEQPYYVFLRKPNL